MLRYGSCTFLNITHFAKVDVVLEKSSKKSVHLFFFNSFSEKKGNFFFKNNVTDILSQARHGNACVTDGVAMQINYLCMAKPSKWQN